MKIHRSKPSSRYTIVPNELLQDQRLSFTARGILTDILSRPDGWSTSADALWELGRRVRPDAAEGRRVVRAAFAEAKTLGYVVEAREQQSDGTFATVLHVYDTAGHGADRRTGSGIPAATCEDEENPSSDRRTGSGMSVANSGNERLPSSDRRTGSGTSIETTNYKEPRDKEDTSLDAYASSMTGDDAHASSGAATASPSNGASTEQPLTKPRRLTLDQRLDAHLADRGPAATDAMLRELIDNARTGLVIWAAKEARKELDIAWHFDPLDDSGGEYARKVVGKALMRLTKPDGGGTSAELDDLLGAFDWPAERRPSPNKKPRKGRPNLPWIVLYARPAEADDPARHSVLCGRVTALSDEALAAKVDEARTYRPGIWKDSEESARNQLGQKGAAVGANEVTRLAYMYVIKHAIDNYKGDWPMFVIPEAPSVLGAAVAAAA